jgi:hypothetical protein
MIKNGEAAGDNKPSRHHGMMHSLTKGVKKTLAHGAAAASSFSSLATDASSIRNSSSTTGEDLAKEGKGGGYGVGITRANSLTHADDESAVAAGAGAGGAGGGRSMRSSSDADKSSSPVRVGLTRGRTDPAFLQLPGSSSSSGFAHTTSMPVEPMSPSHLFPTPMRPPLARTGRVSLKKSLSFDDGRDGGSSSSLSSSSAAAAAALNESVSHANLTHPLGQKQQQQQQQPPLDSTAYPATAAAAAAGYLAAIPYEIPPPPHFPPLPLPEKPWAVVGASAAELAKSPVNCSLRRRAAADPVLVHLQYLSHGQRAALFFAPTKTVQHAHEIWEVGVGSLTHSLLFLSLYLIGANQKSKLPALRICFLSLTHFSFFFVLISHFFQVPFELQEERVGTHETVLYAPAMPRKIQTRGRGGSDKAGSGAKGSHHAANYHVYHAATASVAGIGGGCGNGGGGGGGGGGGSNSLGHGGCGGGHGCGCGGAYGHSKEFESGHSVTLQVAGNRWIQGVPADTLGKETFVLRPALEPSPSSRQQRKALESGGSSRNGGGGGGNKNGGDDGDVVLPSNSPLKAARAFSPLSASRKQQQRQATTSPKSPPNKERSSRAAGGGCGGCGGGGSNSVRFKAGLSSSFSASSGQLLAGGSSSSGCGGGRAGGGSSVGDWREANMKRLLCTTVRSVNGGREVTMRSCFRLRNSTAHHLLIAKQQDPRHGKVDVFEPSSFLDVLVTMMMVRS